MSIDGEDNLLSQDFWGQAEYLWHGRIHSRWFDKSINVSVCEGGAVGADTEHSMLDALVRRWCVSLVLVCFIMYIQSCAHV